MDPMDEESSDEELSELLLAILSPRYLVSSPQGQPRTVQGMAPHISVRESIKWFTPGGHAREPTSTLVLTSPENRFVDIRILKPTDPNFAEHERRIGDEVLPQSRLDWAFAGTSSSELRDAPNDDDDNNKTNDDGATATTPQPKKQIPHSTWTHFVDSRTAAAETVRDEGDMFPLPPTTDGRGRSLECGRMPHPRTGQPTDYEEVWIDEPAMGGGLAGGEVAAAGGAVVAVVLTLQDDENRARGMVVRVGQFCQGVLRAGDAFACERWEWTAGQGRGWRRAARVGDLFLPCGLAMEEGKIRLGGSVRFGDFKWTVVELVD